jgi:hypothetical protein
LIACFHSPRDSKQRLWQLPKSSLRNVRQIVRKRGQSLGVERPRTAPRKPEAQVVISAHNEVMG